MILILRVSTHSEKIEFFTIIDLRISLALLPAEDFAFTVWARQWELCPRRIPSV